MRPGNIASLLSFALCLALTQAFSQVNPELPPHPRLLISGTGDLELTEGSIALPLQKKVMEQANDMLDAPVSTREMEGRRLLGVSRRVLKRVLYLSYAYLTSGRTDYLDRAKDELAAAASFSDWNPSHFLDVAEMTTALAIGYDWLFDDLSPDLRNKIARAIIEKGLRPSFDDRYNYWKNVTNNWNQVCNGGMALGALAIYETNPALADSVLVEVHKSIALPLQNYEPDGAYVEGPSYWTYGSTYHILLLDIWNDLIPEHPLPITKAFLNSGYFLLHARGPGGYFNYGDASLGGSLDPGIFWMADKTGDMSILYHQRELLTDHLHKQKLFNSRFLPMALIWGAELQGDITPPDKRSWLGEGRAPVAFHRTSWSDTAWFIGVKGGSPTSGHAHMDAGTFVMDAGGKRWIKDLGGHNYHRLESQGVDLWGKGRWQVMRYTNFFHSTLTIDSSLMDPDGFAPIIMHRTSADSSYTTVDLTSLYPMVRKLTRKAGIAHSNHVFVSDYIENMDSVAIPVTWTLITQDGAQAISPQTVRIGSGSQTLALNIVEPANGHWHISDATPSNKFEDPNPGTARLIIPTRLEAGGSCQIVVEIEMLE